MDLYSKLKNETMERLTFSYATGELDLYDLFAMIERNTTKGIFKNKSDEKYAKISIQISLIDQLIMLKKVNENKEERMKIGAKLIEIGKYFMEE